MRQHQRWPLGSPIMLGRCRSSCRFMCRCPAGYPEAARASFASIATADQALVFVTTVKCGATACVQQTFEPPCREIFLGGTMMKAHPAIGRRDKYTTTHQCVPLCASPVIQNHDGIERTSGHARVWR